jgi:two-component system chemotaxis response regulator CheB
MSHNRKIRVLVVDDSALVRKLLSEALSKEPGIEVAGTAPDAYIAAEKIRSLRPDVLTLDLEMPGMDGLTFLRKLMLTQPLPVIVVSSLAQSSCSVALEAVRCGAVDILAKPAGPYSVGDLRRAVADKIRAAAAARLVRHDAPHPAPPRPLGLNTGKLSVVALGASTGGTDAIEMVLRALPPDSPPVIATQHIPAGFSSGFAQRLNSVCSLRVREANDGDRLHRGLALIAPGGYHTMVRRTPDGLVIAVTDGPPVCYQKPSVDVLFHSVADAVGNAAAGVLLTGMGSDGASGLLRMRNAGARTLAQNEATCVVFGMPREAIRLGAAERILPLAAIGPALIRAF